MVQKPIFKLTTLSAAVASALVTTPVQAQLEEVIVTATRRSESIQDIPLNISAVSGDQISSQGLSNLADVMRWVPGIHIVDQGNRGADRIVARGLSVDSMSSSETLNNTGGGTVATYVGDIPVYVDMKLKDLERVEVLLGPQGTLYGAGTMGGAIRYIPNKPQFDSSELEVRADVYQIDEADDLSYDTGVTWNIPVSDTFAARVNLDYLDDSGFIDYVYTVREAGVSNADPDFSNPDDVRANLRAVDDANDEETVSARIALRWAPNDIFDGTFTYYYQDQESGARTINSRDSLDVGRYESGLRFVEPSDRKNELYALEFTADLGFAELTSATGWSEYEEEGQRDQTDLLIGLEYSYEAFPSFSAFTFEEVDEERFNQELRLVSTGDSRLSWIVGAFYNKLETNFADSSEFTPGYDQFAVDFFGGVQLRPDSLEYFSRDEIDQEEWAVFGELTFEITDNWQVSVGMRHYDYEFEQKSAVDFPLFETVFNGRDPDSLVIDFSSSLQEEDGNLFKFNTSYDFTDDLMAYFTYSEGYRFGAGNGLGLCSDEILDDVANGIPVGQQQCVLPSEFDYAPDETKNYEIGIRSMWLDSRLTLNGAVYYIDWEDPQLESTTLLASLPITINGEGASTQGVELSFDWLITDNLSLRGSYAYTEAELTDDVKDLVSTVEPPGFGVVRVDGKDGDRLPSSPEHQGTLYGTWIIPMGDMDLGLSYGITAISDVLSKAGERGNGESLSGFAVHDFSADLTTEKWKVSLYVDNVLDEYAETGVRTDTARVQTVSDINGDPVHVRSYFHNVIRPRTIGLRAKYLFDL
jgi:outer membrane receptor protein involved in Fe transport